MAQYAGLKQPEKLFKLAAVLNVLAAQWQNLGKPIRDETYQAAEELLGIREARGRAGFNRRRR